MNVVGLHNKHPIGSWVRVAGGDQSMFVLTREPGSSFRYCVWSRDGETYCEHFHEDDLIPVKDD